MNRENIQREWEKGNLITPVVNILETEDEFLLKALMPGVNKKAVDISLSDGELTLFGQVDNVDESECECFIMKEIPEGNYFRSFKVGEGIDVDKIKARMQDGILNITLPKHEYVKPKEIPIEAS